MGLKTQDQRGGTGVGARAGEARIRLRAQKEVVELCSRFCVLLGLPKSLGQIYGLLYMSHEPLSLDDLAGMLGISKASVSLGTRQLVSWGAIRSVWVHGQRKDYYEADAELREFLSRSYMNYVKPRVAAASRRLESVFASLESDREAGLVGGGEYEVLMARVKSLARLQKRTQALLPLAERLL